MAALDPQGKKQKLAAPATEHRFITLQVSKNADIKVQLKDGNTLFELMRTVCDAWLDEVRGGDGGVLDHMWTLRVPRSDRQHIGPFDHINHGEISENDGQSTDIGTLGLVVGDAIVVEYDMGSTTYFKLNVVAVEARGEGDGGAGDGGAESFPRVVPISSDAGNATFAPHVPPPGMPTLDELFPNLSKLCFTPPATWVLLFPFSTASGCSAAIEAGPNAMGDMLYAPSPFEDAEAFFLALDKAATKEPNEMTREDAFSRFVFPAEHVVTGPDSQGPFKTTADRDAAERKCQQFIRENEEYEAAVAAAGARDKPMSLSGLSAAGLSEAHIYRMCGPQQDATRMAPEERDAGREALRARGFRFAEAFPKCAEGFAGPALQWISFKRSERRGGGVLRVCHGEGAGVHAERGEPITPGGELARLDSRTISSLQELFCAAEALWPAANDAAAYAASVALESSASGHIGSFASSSAFGDDNEEEDY